jgi:hypothetical protein
MPVAWSDEVDDVLRGDLTVGVAYLTPAGGAVVTAVSPLGLRDRERGTVGFTTSLGFGRKLERMKAQPKVALAYHTREHGIGDRSNQRYILVEGVATFDPAPNAQVLEAIGERVVPYLGPPQRGIFWDRWLSAYYADRVVVTVAVTRVVEWQDLAATGRPKVHGKSLSAEQAVAQAPPKKGTGPRVDAVKNGKRAAKLPYRLLAYRQADGYPSVLPVEVTGATTEGIRLRVPAGVRQGGRRAGLLAHTYRDKLIGLESRQNTGWLEVDGTDVLYAPHTESGFKAPPNKTVVLLANGFMARRGLAQARKSGRLEALR